MKPKRRLPLGIVSRIWHYVEEPKNVTLVQAFVVYLAAIIGGILSFIYPPSTTSIILGDFLVAAVSTLMVIGGSFGIATSIIGWWWVERTLGIGLLGLGLLLYIYSVAEAQWLSDGNRWMQLTWLTIAAGGLVIRWMRIRKSNYDPVA